MGRKIRMKIFKISSTLGCLLAMIHASPLPHHDGDHDGNGAMTDFHHDGDHEIIGSMFNFHHDGDHENDELSREKRHHDGDHENDELSRQKRHHDGDHENEESK